MAGNQDEQQHDDGAQDGEDREGARVEYLGERFGRIEAEQAQQRGILEQIRDAIGGRGAAQETHDQAEARTQHRLAHPPAETMADQVRRAVREVGAEQQQQEEAAAHAADHQKLREQAEKPPREAMGGIRGRIAAAMYGRPG